MADDRRSSQAAAYQNAKAHLTGGVANRVNADVVDQRRGSVDGRPRHCNLELARQICEFRVERRPLAKELAIRPRIDDFVAGDSSEMVGSDVAHAVATGL